MEGAFEIYNNLSKELASIVIHHTDEFPLENSINDFEVEDPDYLAVVKEIQRQHMVDKGWSDIAYHFLIAPDGTIYEGRDLRVRGTHTEGFNTGQVGIALIGNYDGDDPSPEQVQALESLVASLSESYGIGCLGQHNHFNSTACPGDHLGKVVGNLRERHNMGSYQCYRQP